MKLKGRNWEYVKMILRNTFAALVRRSPLSPTEMLRTSFCTLISLIGFDSFFSEAYHYHDLSILSHFNIEQTRIEPCNGWVNFVGFHRWLPHFKQTDWKLFFCASWMLWQFQIEIHRLVCSKFDHQKHLRYW